MRLGKVAAVGVVLVLVLVVGPVSSTHAGPISPSGATPALFANPQTRSVSGDTRSSSLNGSNSSGPYSIDFSEFGLANNVTWNVTLMGITFPTRSSVPIGAEPTGTLYDPENHNMYIALDSGFVNVYNGSTNAQIGSIPVGLSARWMALDTANGDVYVTNTGSNNVSVIDGRTDKVIDNVNVESNPIGIAYDATNGNIYVANSQFWSGSGGNTISVINTTQNTVVLTISVGNTPRTIAYDPTDQLLFVPNYYSNNLSLISTSTDRVVGSISFNSTVIGPMYDSVNHLLYVAEDQLNLLEEVNVSTDSIVGSIPVGPVPQHPVYDPLDGFIFVPDEGALSIAVIDPTSEEVIGWLPSEASAGAAGVDLANALNLGEPLLEDGGGEVVDLGDGVFVGGQAENHDRRIGGIDLAISWIARQVGGEISSRGIDCCFHIARCAINIAAEVELNGDRCAAECAGGGHLGHASDVTELPLQRRGDGRRHNFSAGSRQACAD